MWHKSSACGSESECVEIALCRDRVLARDSKDAAGPVLTFSRSSWEAFLAALQTERWGES